MKRIIARIDIKNNTLIKTVQLEGLRVVGEPKERMLAYYEQGVDELIYMDIVASLYGRNGLFDLIDVASKNCFVPLTVGGGIRNLEDAKNSMMAGADKLAINTAAAANPKIISELADVLGSQAVVLSVEAQKMEDGGWQAFCDNGREPTGRDVLLWIEEACSLGIGEIMVTSIANEGMNKGFDLELLQAVGKIATVPVIASGGYGNSEHGIECLSVEGIDAMTVAGSLHFDRQIIPDIKLDLRNAGIAVR